MQATDRMRIGLVIGQLTYGGAEGQLCELACQLRASCDVFVYCLSEKIEPYAERLRADGVPLRVLPARRRLDPLRVVELARWLRRDGVEVVHAFLFIASAYTYLATRLARRVRLVTSARNCKPEPSRVRRFITSRAFRYSDAVICNSHEMARFAHRHYDAPRDRTHVVYNGVDADRFSVHRGSDGLTVGTVGRIEVQKNLDLFLDAAGRVHEARPDARFEIVGEGSERERLEARADELGLGRVVSFKGTTADVAGFFAGLDQFWLTSDWEGTPNVVLEAMSAGLPIVATRVGGIPELIEDGTSGVLVDKGDAAATSGAALHVASSPELQRRLGEQARQVVHERFSLQAMAEATVAVYRRVVRGRA